MTPEEKAEELIREHMKPLKAIVPGGLSRKFSVHHAAITVERCMKEIKESGGFCPQKMLFWRDVIKVLKDMS